MTDTIIAALVAAAVSLIVSLLAHASEKRKLRSELRRHEQEMRRRLTEKLLDLRLAAYPKAFAVTDNLRGDLILSVGDVTAAYANEVLHELLAWHRDSAGFLLTRHSLQAFRDLRKALAAKPEEGASYSRGQRKKMFECKNRFRAALKQDLTLLYQEDGLGEEEAAELEP